MEFPSKRAKAGAAVRTKDVGRRNKRGSGTVAPRLPRRPYAVRSLNTQFQNEAHLTGNTASNYYGRRAQTSMPGYVNCCKVNLVH